MLSKLLAEIIEEGVPVADIAYTVRNRSGITITEQSVRNHLTGGRAGTEALRGYRCAFGWSYEDMIDEEQ